MRTFLFLAITLLLFGTILTAMLWPHRADQRVRKLLAVIWVFIGISIPIAALAAITSVGVSALFVFDLLSERLRTAGVPKLLAQGIAAIGVLPVLYGFVLVFFRSEWKRYVGVGILSACAATYFFTSYAFARRHDGYVIRADNTLDYCDEPGVTDRITLKPCRAMTAEVLDMLSRTRRGEAVSVFDWPPPDQILTTDGKPQRWYCPRSDGSYVFAIAPVYDPITGRKCLLPTREIIQRYREEHGVPHSKNAAPTPVRQYLASPINLPFREDFMDGEFDSLNAVGDWRIKSCGGSRCICVDGTGPWSFGFALSSVPLHLFSLHFLIYGEGWQSQITYEVTDPPPRVGWLQPVVNFPLIVTHNWRTENQNTSCVRGTCRTPVVVPPVFQAVSLRPYYSDAREWYRNEPNGYGYQQKVLASAAVYLSYRSRTFGDPNTTDLVLADGLIAQARGEWKDEAWSRVTHLVRHVSVELRQPFSGQLCVAQVEIRQPPERLTASDVIPSAVSASPIAGPSAESIGDLLDRMDQRRAHQRPPQSYQP